MAGKKKRPESPCCKCAMWRRKALDFGECGLFGTKYAFGTCAVHVGKERP